MNKKSKKAYLFIASIMILTTSCIPPVTYDDPIGPSIPIPNPKTGTITGVISLKEGNITKNDTNKISIRLIRNEDVVFPKDTKKIIERKGQRLGRFVINENGQFVIPNILPGEVELNISYSEVNVTKIVIVRAGEVLKVDNIVLDNGKNKIENIAKDLIISGKVFLPNGEHAPKAVVSDVTKGLTSVKVETREDGTFAFKLPPFQTPRILEVTLGKLSTSFTVQPDQTDNIEIPLLENSRSIRGKIIDSVNKKPVENLQVVISDTAIGAITDKDGNFMFKGVPLNKVDLDIGGISGYIQKKQVVASGNTYEEIDMKTIEIVPLGNLLVNVSVEDSLDDSKNDKLPFGSLIIPNETTEKANETLNFYKNFYETISCGNIEISKELRPKYYLSNLYKHLEPLKGIIQLGGTDFIKNFDYSVTPILTPKPECPSSASIEKKEVNIYLKNIIEQVSIPGIPGGEYTISISIEGHETKKGIKILVPSNDTISTENIKLKSIKRIVNIGDVKGKVLFKEINGNQIDAANAYNGLPTVDKRFVVVSALTSENTIRDASDLIKIITGVNTGEKIGNLNPYVITDSVYAENSEDNPVRDKKRGSIETNGDFVLKNVTIGTRFLLAAVINKVGDNYSFDPQFIPSAYTSLNVIANVDNKAPDLYITRRNFRK